MEPETLYLLGEYMGDSLHDTVVGEDFLKKWGHEFEREKGDVNGRFGSEEREGINIGIIL